VHRVVCPFTPQLSLKLVIKFTYSVKLIWRRGRKTTRPSTLFELLVLN